MSLATLRSFLRSLLRRARMERDMDSELQFHLDARVDDLVAGGLDRAAARRRARHELGDPLRWKEQGREARGLRLVDQLGADLRYGVRWLRRSPAFAAAAVISIALGIGANTAIFSLVNAVLLRLMPVDDPKSLVLLALSTDRAGLGSSFPYPFYQQLQQTSTALAGVICWAGMSSNVEAGGPAERVTGEMVSGNYFEVLGVRPHVGRLFTPDDNRVPGGHPLVVLSHGYWQRRFGGNPLVVGQTIRVNTHPMTIIGVTPPGFHGTELGVSQDIRVPIVMQAEMYASRSRLENPREWWLQIIGRLNRSVSPEAAQQQLHASFEQFSAGLPSDWPRDRRLILLDGSRGRPTLQNRFGKPLVVLSGLATAVLLLVCLNVANLLLVRTAVRRRELSIRTALGASRGRIVTQLLVETLLIAVTGGALGLLLARWGALVLANIALPTPAGPVLDIAMDLRVLGFATALSVGTGLVCGLSAALSGRRTNLVAALSTEGRQIAGGRLLGRKLLVAAQIAVSFTLLVGAGLFTRTLANLRYLDFGFETEHLLLLTVNPTLSGYQQPQLRVFYDEVTQRVATLPGVQSTSLAMMPLLGRNSWGSGLTLDTGVHDDRPGPERNAVGPGYFSTIGTPIIAGREFTEADVASGQKVAVVNEAFARRYFGGQALGRRIGPGGRQGSADFTIIGIARDGKYAEVRENTAPFWYVPYQQLAQLGQLTLHVRTIGDPEALAADVRHAIAAIDKRVTVFRVKTMAQQISDQLVLERLLATLAAGFAILAILLAALGLYGVTTYATAARTREIGVRMALGASPSAIFALIFRQTTMLIGLGLIVGLALALTGVGYLRSLLFGLEPTDPFVMAVAVLAVVTVTTVAAWLPARRATRIDPTTALQ
jgi:predicted permease